MIAPDEPIVAENFINQSEADPTPANNEGKVPKLEANGKIHSSFLGGGGILYGVSSAGDDDYEVTIDGVEAYTTGMVVGVLADVGNSGTATLNINSLGVKNIKKSSSVDLTTADIRPGQIFMAVYDGTQFLLQGAGPRQAASSGSGSSISGTLPITLNHAFGVIPRQYHIVLLSRGDGSINIDACGSITGRLGDNDIYAGGIFQIGPNDTNLYLINTTVDANNITLSLNTTVGSPGSIPHTWFIRAIEY